jgi:hypothetical protein
MWRLVSGLLKKAATASFKLGADGVAERSLFVLQANVAKRRYAICHLRGKAAQ